MSLRKLPEKHASVYCPSHSPLLSSSVPSCRGLSEKRVGLMGLHTLTVNHQLEWLVVIWGRSACIIQCRGWGKELSHEHNWRAGNFDWNNQIYASGELQARASLILNGLAKLSPQCLIRSGFPCQALTEVHWFSYPVVPCFWCTVRADPRRAAPAAHWPGSLERARIHEYSLARPGFYYQCSRLHDKQTTFLKAYITC
jgi:hypothetical protein